MTHSQLVDIARRWLLNKGCGFAFAELKACTSNGEIPDAIGWKGQVSLLIECKATRSDFLSDKGKYCRRKPDSGMGNFRWYMAPKGVILPEDLPERWGLIAVDRNSLQARQVVGPKGNVFHGGSDFFHRDKHSQAEFEMMYSALRRLHLRGVMHMVQESPFKEQQLATMEAA